MSESPKGHITAAWIMGTLGLVGVVLAAIIGLGLPFVQRLANPPEVKTVVVVVTATPPPTSVIAQATSKPSPFATAKPTIVLPTPTPDVWQFYVDDIKLQIPSANVTTDTLKEIARKIPSNVPFLAEAEVGLRPYQYNWRILDREGPAFLNAPEGGYAYIAWGFGTVKSNEFSINFQAIEDMPYVILVIGKPDDGTATDLNTSLQLTNFQAGFAGTNFAFPAKGQVFPNRKVVNKAWLSQQLWWAASHRAITVSIWDVSNGKRLDYDVNPTNFTWTAK